MSSKKNQGDKKLAPIPTPVAERPVEISTERVDQIEAEEAFLVANGDEDELEVAEESSRNPEIDITEELWRANNGFSSEILRCMRRVVRGLIATKDFLGLRVERDNKGTFVHVSNQKQLDALNKAAQRIRPVHQHEFNLNLFGGSTANGKTRVGFHDTLANILRYNGQLSETNEVKAVQLLLSEVPTPKSILALILKGEQDFRERQSKISKALGAVKRLELDALKAKVLDLATKADVDVTEKVEEATKKPTHQARYELLGLRKTLMEAVKTSERFTRTAHEDKGFAGRTHGREDRNSALPRRPRGRGFRDGNTERGGRVTLD